MREPYEILVKPLVSEKSMMMMGENKYSFAVAKDANKIEIKNAVEKLFNVTVLLSLIHIPSPRDRTRSRMPSSA